MRLIVILNDLFVARSFWKKSSAAKAITGASASNRTKSMGEKRLISIFHFNDNNCRPNNRNLDSNTKTTMVTVT